MAARDGLKPTGEPGVFYSEHKKRKHGIKYDRQWTIRQTLGGVTRVSVLGWMGEGVLLGDALNRAEFYRSNFKWNKLNPDQPRKPLCAADELREAKAIQDDFPTFTVFAERFLRNYVERKCAIRTFQDYSDHINKVFIPVLGDMRMIDITRKQIVKLVEGLAIKAPTQANRKLATIRKMFSYAVDVGFLEINPAMGIKPPGKETPKTRVLDLQEITTLFKVLEAQDNRDTRDILRLITLTDQRPGEVRAMHLSQFKRDNKGLWFELSGDDTKNSEPTRIYLNDMAEQIIQSRINDLGVTHYIFPADSQSGFLHKGTLVNRVRRIQTLMQKEGVDYFTAHDLRRSAATGLARLGYGSIVDDVLNHKPQGITRRVYDLYSRGPEIQRALTAWGETIQRTVDGTQADVIEINS